MCGLFPAASVGDDIEVYTDESRTEVAKVLHNLRQQTEKPKGFNYCLSDYVAPKESGKRDWVGAFAVTGGIGERELADEYKAQGDDYNAIMIQAVADRLAEAFAEYLHERVRKDIWGYAADEALSNEDLIREKYQGIRPAPGYPACPEHTEKGPHCGSLLNVEENDWYVTDDRVMRCTQEHPYRVGTSRILILVTLRSLRSKQDQASKAMLIVKAGIGSKRKNG